jgi:hypothetical protein
MKTTNLIKKNKHPLTHKAKGKNEKRGPISYQETTCKSIDTLPTQAATKKKKTKKYEKAPKNVKITTNKLGPKVLTSCLQHI